MDSSCHGSRPSGPSSPTVTPLGAHVVIQSGALHQVCYRGHFDYRGHDDECETEPVQGR